MIASALAPYQSMPEPFNQAVSVSHVASVGPLPLCHPLARNAG
jgi:hypothetical protein